MIELTQEEKYCIVGALLARKNEMNRIIKFQSLTTEQLDSHIKVRDMSINILDKLMEHLTGE